jgi:hypothetical protein
MKKFYSMLFALLLVCGVAYATNIPSVVEPSNGGPEFWILSVYNNSGTALDTGDIVIWDVSSSTGDDDNWVTTTTTASTQLAAGIVYPKDIGVGETGTIAIRGPVQVDVMGVVTNGKVCTSTEAAKATTCLGASEANSIGIATTATVAGSATVLLK